MSANHPLPHTEGELPSGKSQGRANQIASVRQLKLITRENNEFLPAALEVIASPPSPIRLQILWFICLLFTAGLVWSYFNKLDIYAVAEGKIQPSGRSKIVQPLETGKVRTLYVQNGSKVQQGDILIELDPTETAAEVEAIARDLDATVGELSRRPVAIQASSSEPAAPPPIPFGPETSAPVRQREQAVLVADLGQLNATRQTIRAQIREKTALADRLNLSISAREKLLKVLQERTEMRQTLVDKEAGTRASVIDASELYERASTDQAYDKGQLFESAASIESLKKKFDETTTQFVAEQTQKIADAERKRDHLVQDLIKARSKNERTRLVAPIDGTVQQLVVTTIGQVVTQGQSLMTVVPQDGPIEVEALVLNRDIGFVSVGQDAIIKVESFPFTRYGTLNGKVIRTSRDAVDEQEIRAQSDMQATGAQARPTPGTAPRGQNLVFPVTIQLQSLSINVDQKDVPLVPGMAVTAEIRTGERRAIDYILAPIREAVTQSGHER